MDNLSFIMSIKIRNDNLPHAFNELPNLGQPPWHAIICQTSLEYKLPSMGKKPKKSIREMHKKSLKLNSQSLTNHTLQLTLIRSNKWIIRPKCLEFQDVKKFNSPVGNIELKIEVHKTKKFRL